MEATEDPRALNGLATRWPKGISGNPHGRPLGSKNAFGPDYIRDFQIVWQESGIECEAFMALALRFLIQPELLSGSQMKTPARR
jgi:hypothetical protein